MAMIVFDTETTGLVKHPSTPLDKQPHIIEIGAVLLDEKYKISSSYSTLLKPPIPLTDEITRITGIAEDDLLGALTFADVVEDLQAFFLNAPTVCAHNFAFDKAMIENECRRISFDWIWPARQLCSMQEVAEEFGGFVKLTKLYEHTLGKPLKQTHRAMEDVLALVEIIAAVKLK